MSQSEKESFNYRHYDKSMTSMSSPSNTTPKDVLSLHRTQRHRIASSSSHQATTTMKLKNIFINSREREELMTACAKGDVDKVTHLLNHTKPNLNPDMVRDSKLRTPLLVACAAGKADVVRALIRCGADVNNPMGDIVGNKPLDLAVISNNVDTVLALLEAGAHVAPPHQPIPQRIMSSPLRLAQSRLDLLIRSSTAVEQQQQQDKSDVMSQVNKIIQLLQYFVGRNGPTQEDYAAAQQELDTLTSKLSSIALASNNNEEQGEVEIMKGLQDVISKLKI